MNTERQIRILLIMLALIMGAANGAWALSTTDIIIDGGITHGSVAVTSVDDATRVVTITVTPASGYFVNKSDIIVQKLLDPSNASTRSNTPDIAETLEVSGPSSSSEEADYTFVVPADYAGALVTVTFTGMNPATATVTPNSLAYTGEEQELVTLGTVVGGAATDPVTYSLSSSGSYSTTIPTGTNAGTYTVYYKVAGDANHAEGSGSVSVTIDQAQITSVILSNNAINYDGNAHTVSISSVKAGTIDVPSSDYTFSGNTATDVGTYTVTVTAKSESVNFTGSTTASFRIVEQTITIINSSTSEITDGLNGHYLLMGNISASVLANLYSTTDDFTGTLEAGSDDDGNFYKINMSGYNHALFNTINGSGTVKNIVLENVSISSGTTVNVGGDDKEVTGAIANVAKGSSRIYNCGILSGSVSGGDYVGGLVGLLDVEARVINCYSYANVSGDDVAAGIVGYNNVASTSSNHKTMVVNCMFYGDITDATAKYPVYGGNKINNAGATGINNYNYFLETATFDESYSSIDDYNCSWPVAKKYLTRYEIYRNILNSNRRLCTWWVEGADNTSPSDADVKSVGIAKWVLDLTIAPYPILKIWGKYPSVINPDSNMRVNPLTKAWINRSSSSKWGTNDAPDTEGQILGSVFVSIKGGDNNSSASDSRTINITAMDKAYNDYCYGKIQLPYYNEIFGNPEGDTWAKKYGNNYTSKVVTGWKITKVNGSTSGSGPNFVEDWESGYNFADRTSTKKDIFSISGRVFAQGGYYYVPDGVTSIEIEAYWGDAVYLYNADRYLDRVNNAGNSFTISGQLPTDIGNEKTVQTSLGDAVGQLTIQPTKTVYDQAIVLVGNYQNNAFHSSIQVSGSEYDSKAKPFTIMSADFDFDNEPDFCFQAGMSSGGRIYSQPIRFDFLMAPDLAMAARSSTDYYGMRIWCPQGHFEITETSYMYITQFEYEERNTGNNHAYYHKHEAPMILNGGEFMQIVSTEAFTNASENATATVYASKTSYFLMGGNLYMLAFTPGAHGNTRCSTRHCAVNAIGGEYHEFYLSGMFRSDFYNKTDNPHAYLDGGYFGIVAGAGMESVGGKNETDGGNVTFKINHSIIGEFYGGGINANRPVTGNISITIDNSKVTKYCGGPKMGDMSNTKTITTNATGSTFDEFYGGGNGGTNNERRRIKDSNGPVPAPSYENRVSEWGGTSGYGFNNFSPLHYSNGYETEFEFELLPDTRGTSNVVKRTYTYWATFARTTVAPVTNIITDCTFNGNYYGGGNLGAVDGNVTSTLQGHTVVNGSAFGAGFSASIPTFQVHDPSTVEYPYRDFAGFIHDGSLKHSSIQYKWIHEIPSAWGKSPDFSKNKDLFFEDPDNSGDWYVYTSEDLTGLGTVSGNATIIIKGTTEVAGDVFGGGAQSAVNGNTIVTLLENANVNGNVFGGGDKGVVSGSATVNIQ